MVVSDNKLVIVIMVVSLERFEVLRILKRPRSLAYEFREVSAAKGHTNLIISSRFCIEQMFI